MLGLVASALLWTAPPILPDPERLPRRVVTARGRGPRWYRKEPSPPVWVARVALGAGGRLAGSFPREAAIAFDLAAGGRFGLTRGPARMGALAEVGYARSAWRGAHVDLLALGAGLGLLDRGSTVALVGRLLLGRYERLPASGARAGLLFEFFDHRVGVEVGYQVVFPRGLAPMHEFRAMVSFNFAGPLQR